MIARNILLRGFGVLAMLLGGSASRAQPDPANLPVFTSPIDITGLKLLLVANAPDRETGKPADIALPTGVLGPKLNQLFATPLSTQIDQYWNTNRDPATGKTQRQAACDGIKQQVAKSVTGSDASRQAYDITCNLASKGQLLAKQVGSNLSIGYLLTNNTVSFASTSPLTCHAGNGTPFCANDPRFTVRFATEITTDVRVASLCQIFADAATVFVLGASIEATNGTADIIRFFSGQKFVAGEVAITNTVRKLPLPLDGAFNELRTSDACTGRTPGVSRVLAAFNDTAVEIDPRKGVILRVSDAGLAVPSVSAPNSDAASTPSVPSFSRPMVSTAQPSVTAGNAVQTNGSNFPPNSNFATALPVGLQRGGSGVCFGAGTALEWGHVGGPLRVQQLPNEAQDHCATSFNATNLTPGTGFQFRARDCDLVTCSRWSPILKATTDKVDPALGKVVLMLDGGTPLGAVIANARGSFATSITIPAATPAGPHTLHATNGSARADAVLQVTAPSPAGGGNASIMMVGVLPGETGCPNHPISSTQTDDTFMLFGRGFASGTVAVRLDVPSGTALGTATVHADGSICQQMHSPPANAAGAHTLVAVQNGAVAARAPVTFVTPSLVR